MRRGLPRAKVAAVVCGWLCLALAGAAYSQVTVSGPAVTVSADASDNVGVVGVQFLLDGSPLGNEDLSPPYTFVWDTTRTPDGPHLLSARARDAAGNSALAAPVTVSVDNAASPQAVVLTSPVSGAVVAGTIPVSANASGNGVAGVRFLVDGVQIGIEDTTPPYATPWDTTLVVDGAHSLTAIARDTSGTEATSAPVPVTVTNLLGGAPPPPPGSDPEPPPPGSDPEPPPPQPEPDPAPPSGSDPQPAKVSVPPGDMRLSLALSRDAAGMTQIHADFDLNGVKGLELQVDGQAQVSTPGTSLDHTWDSRNEMGYHEVRAVRLNGPAVVASASVLDSPSTNAGVSVQFDLSPFPLIGATFVRLQHDLAGIQKTDVFVDGVLVRSFSGSGPVEYGWDSRNLSGAHEVLVVAYNGTGVAASFTVLYRPN